MAKGYTRKLVQFMYLECREKSLKGKKHFKFYRVELLYDKVFNCYEVEATWGRIGRAGQTMVKFRGEELDAVVNDMEKLLVKKLYSKGYVLDDMSTFKENAREGDRESFENE